MRTTYLVTVSSTRFRVLRKSVEILANDRAEAFRRARMLLAETRAGNPAGGAWDRWKAEEPAPEWPYWRQVGAGAWGDD